MRESKIEDHLVKRVKAAGGLTRKLTWVGRKGAPDRVIFMPGGLIFFVELKRPGEAPDPCQVRELECLFQYGQNVRVLDSIADVDSFVDARLKT